VVSIVDKITNYRRHVFRWEFVDCVRDEQTSFADRSISDHDTFDGLIRHFVTDFQFAIASSSAFLLSKTKVLKI
jgi:hypothetical protein